MSRIIVCPDTHVPDHDRRAWACFLKACSTSKAQTLVVIGDFADYWAISRHAKQASRIARLKLELPAVNACLDELDSVGFSRKVFCQGNHEERLERYINERAPELDGLLDTRDLFRLRARRHWEWIPYRKHLKIGKSFFSHEVGPCGKNVTIQSLDAFQHPIVIGHSHRAGVAYGGSVAGDRRVAMSVGWLGDLSKISYMHQSQTKDWQHAFGLIDQDPAGNSWMQVIPIIGGKCIIDGKMVKA